MNRWFSAVWILSIAFAGVGCPSRTPAASSGPAGSMITVKIGGAEGAAIRGFYIDDGKRIPLQRKLPVVLEGRGISIVAVGKLNAADNLSVEANSEDGGYVGMYARPGDRRGIGVQIGDGTSAGQYVSDRDLTERPGNS